MEEPTIDLRDLGGRLRRLALTLAVGVVVSAVVGQWWGLEWPFGMPGVDMMHFAFSVPVLAGWAAAALTFAAATRRVARRGALVPLPAARIHRARLR